MKILKSDNGEFMHRWSLLPENRFFNVHLQKRFANDPGDQYLHDHPYWNISIILSGGYVEIVKFDAYSDDTSYRNWMMLHRAPGSFVFRRAKDAHRILVGHTCWSIWIVGPVTRRWGFYTPEGWIHWRKFVSITRGK